MREKLAKILDMTGDIEKHNVFIRIMEAVTEFRKNMNHIIGLLVLWHFPLEEKKRYN